jgi:hypothetical protein
MTSVELTPDHRGKIPRASFVMACVKKDELSRFVLEKQPINAIAAYYDRHKVTVRRAIELLSKYESQIASGHFSEAAREIWKGRLGWERSPSYIEARSFIERKELMPKDTCGPKRRVRRKPAKEVPAAPADAPSNAAISQPESGAATAQTTPPGGTNPPPRTAPKPSPSLFAKTQSL